MDVFDLFAKLSLDKSEYDKGLDDAEKSAGGFGSKLKTAMKVGGAALAATGTAMAALGKQSINNFGEYEQLVGGVQKLYGNMGKGLEEYAKSVGKSTDEVRSEWQSLENAQNAMIKNAQNAYATAGMSANQYIQNVTGFSAALINSLEGNTEEAARVADMAMRDIADNANTFGTQSAEDLARVYQALAKGQYMTLDNLNLGFGGTKEGMQALIDKANELAVAQGKSGDLQIDSYADIVQAIHLVQENLNITGTTANEANKTIQGSINQAKAAYQNLLTGMADETQDFNGLLTKFIDSIGTVAGNLIPRIKVVATGFTKLIKGVGPQLVSEIPGILQEVLPSVLEAAVSLVDAVVKIAPDLLKTVINAITQNLPMLITSAIEMATILITSVATILPNLIPNIVTAVVDMLPVIIDAVIGALPIIIPALIKGAILVVAEIVKALPKIMSALIKAIPRVITDIIKAFNPFADKAGEVGSKAVDKIVEFFKNLPYKLGYWAGEAIASVIKFFTELPGKVSTWLTNTIDKIITWGNNLKTTLPRLAREAINNFITFFRELPGKIFDIASNVATGFKNGFSGAWKGVGNVVLSSAKGLIDGVKRVFDERSPSKVFAQIGAFAALGLGEGWDEEIGDVQDNINNSLDFGTATITGDLPTGGASRVSNVNNTFYIYGAAGQDINELADEIERRFSMNMERSGKAFA